MAGSVILTDTTAVPASPGGFHYSPGTRDQPSYLHLLHLIEIYESLELSSKYLVFRKISDILFLVFCREQRVELLRIQYYSLNCMRGDRQFRLDIIGN